MKLNVLLKQSPCLLQYLLLGNNMPIYKHLTWRRDIFLCFIKVSGCPGLTSCGMSGITHFLVAFVELRLWEAGVFQGEEPVDTEFKALESGQAEKFKRSWLVPVYHVIHPNLPLKITKTKQDKDA